jgi:hypothetical protein
MSAALIFLLISLPTFAGVLADGKTPDADRP